MRYTWMIGMMMCSMAGLALAENPAAERPRPLEAILADLTATETRMRQTPGFPSDMINPRTRAQIAPKLIPVMKKLSQQYEELGQASPRNEGSVIAVRRQLNSFLWLMGDDQAGEELRKEASSSDAGRALAAKATILQIRWWLTTTDPVAQANVADDVRRLAEANPDSPVLPKSLSDMLFTGAASRENKQKLRDVVLNILKSEPAADMAEAIKDDLRLESHLDKPLVIEGTTLDGTKFSSASFKGKVVLLDHWATWCGPCIAELPRLKKFYAGHRAKGFEIIGISWDAKPEALKAFLDANPEMSWPQLFDGASAPGGKHAIAANLAIRGIPTFLVIDRKGILRSVDAAGKDWEQLAEQLLAE